MDKSRVKELELKWKKLGQDIKDMIAHLDAILGKEK